MADTLATPVPEEDEESLVSFSTLVLALLTLAVYILFLKPTAENNNENNNTNNTNNTTRTRERQRQQRGGGRRVAPQQQAQQSPRRRLHVSENAMEVLGKCQSLPPHVVANSSSSSKQRSIGGYEILSENGLVAFSHTKAASTKISAETQQDPKAASLLQRKERAKILSRLFAAKDFGKALPAPPSKGSTFVVGVSREKHLANADQRSSLLQVLRGLATHYTVLVVVTLDSSSGGSSSSSYEPTQKLHADAISLLRGEDEISESVLPGHRVLLAGSAKGKVALVRQLSTNIGLTVDFDTDVKDELERFGYDVSIVEDWKTILPAAKKA